MNPHKGQEEVDWENLAASTELVLSPKKEDNITTVTRYEVVVAFNLDPPYRYSQEYSWLEVIAASAKEAINAASEWVLKAGPGYEATSFCRVSQIHDSEISVVDNHILNERIRKNSQRTLMVAWNLPLSNKMPETMIVRDPSSGTRVGFVATKEAEDRWLPQRIKGKYRLLTSRPIHASEPICLVPLVEDLRGDDFQKLANEEEAPR